MLDGLTYSMMFLLLMLVTTIFRYCLICMFYALIILFPLLLGFYLPSPPCPRSSPQLFFIVSCDPMFEV